jgi:hypothetical protein
MQDFEDTVEFKAGCNRGDVVSPHTVNFKQSPEFTSALVISSEQKEIVRIDHAGDIYWKERLVKTDDKFKSAMLDMVKTMWQIRRNAEVLNSPDEDGSE